MEPGATGQAEDTLAALERLRRRSHRRAHGGAWLPALGIAVLLLASTALYRHPLTSPTSIAAEHPWWAGLPDEQRSPVASYAFWFVGTPLLFAGIGLWYRWRARRLGVRVAWPVVAGTGLGVLALLAVLAAVPTGPVPDGLAAPDGPYWPGLLTPLLPLAAAVVVLGRAERSPGLLAAGVWMGLLTAWLCTSFPLGALPGWAGRLLGGGSGLGGQLGLRPGHYLVLMALPLLAVAAVRLVSGRGPDRA
ncbi:hypothetical protein Q3W71_27155 [Micromonospora sp. C28SCA-DRY-2]|uniref:hypothetical protein n=1 Tax=Micromonospora sp. C28SCA-DRY-2 TaxID=3059522 RepID=UPI002676C9B0|nr:hypothetical protein [Micromonospora sp. C28SCA-DRY-2]MDO3705355.1 hypothetical protein [Micromonospora sp. C28SCA-DRY-2]